MSQPWGISGPGFLWLYGGALVIALAVALGVRARARRPQLVEQPPELDLESVAYLAGGARRVLELAIARLIEDGAVRANRGGTIRAVRDATAWDPLGDAILKKLGRGSPNINTLIRSVRATKHLDQVSAALAAFQLVLTPKAAARANRLARLWLFLLLFVGVARFVNGIIELQPVGFLMIQLVVTVMVLIVLSNRRIRPRTVHGDRALDQARAGITDGVELVALGGLAAFPDDDVRGALGPVVTGSVATASWSYGAGTYASCGGTSSCGGSSGGGGSSCGGGGGGGGCGGGGGG
ncbi:TIGR04222 domain-containing membrane protein [Actinophytocola sediminis]